MVAAPDSTDPRHRYEHALPFFFCSRVHVYPGVWWMLDLAEKNFCFAAMTEHACEKGERRARGVWAVCINATAA
jgi:hypothetical protein